SVPVDQGHSQAVLFALAVGQQEARAVGPYWGAAEGQRITALDTHHPLRVEVVDPGRRVHPVPAPLAVADDQPLTGRVPAERGCPKCSPRSPRLGLLPIEGFGAVLLLAFEVVDDDLQRVGLPLVADEAGHGNAFPVGADGRPEGLGTGV